MRPNPQGEWCILGADFDLLAAVNNPGFQCNVIQLDLDQAAIVVPGQQTPLLRRFLNADPGGEAETVLQVHRRGSRHHQMIAHTIQLHAITDNRRNPLLPEKLPT